MQYKKDLLVKIQKFTVALARKGIGIALDNLDEGYGKYIAFTIETDMKKDGVRTLMVATNTGLIRSQWKTLEGEQEADVSPLLMVEFGAGLLANNPNASKLGMGTGTFPGQTHAEDPNGWWYMDLDGVWHHSYGISPTMPMWNAATGMMNAIRETAKEVFG